MKFKKIIVLLILSIMMMNFTGCTSDENTSMKDQDNNTDMLDTSQQDNNSVSENFIQETDMFSDRDKETGYDEESSVVITLNNNAIDVNFETVKVSGSIATITDEGSYILRGNLSEGQIIVDAEKTDKLQIILDNVTINNNSSSPIYIKQSDKVFITLSKDSKNTLSTSGEFVAIDEENIDAVIYSKEDLTLNGEGSLSITTEYGHGIVSKDDLVFTSGNYEIKSSGKGISGKDSVRIGGGDFNIVSGKDSIQSQNIDDDSLGFVYINDGTFNINSQIDGIDGEVWVEINRGKFNIITNEKGVKADGNIVINGGTFNINSIDDSVHSNEDVVINGGNLEILSEDDGIHADSNVSIIDGTVNILKSYEGIEGQSIDIIGGNISLISSDDGLNSAGGNDGSGIMDRAGKGNFAADENCYIKISGGTINVNAKGDGVDSNGNLYVTGGETYISGPTDNGNGALDYNGTAEITGGTFIAVGSSGMAQNFGDSSTQGAILVNTPSITSGTISLKDSNGKEIVTFTPEKEYSSVVLSTPDIKKGESYTINLGSDVQTIEMTSFIYGAGGMNGMHRGVGERPGEPGERPEGFEERPKGEQKRP